ncbi:hypothetical protein Hanom_Chr10g00939171 [Helianthus anomalus]
MVAGFPLTFPVNVTVLGGSLPSSFVSVLSHSVTLLRYTSPLSLPRKPNTSSQPSAANFSYNPNTRRSVLLMRFSKQVFVLIECVSPIFS